MVNSRQKGARGEREWRDFLRSHGFNARRGQQYEGSSGSPDVVSESPELQDFHFEVKRVETFQLDKSFEQAFADAAGKVPVVAHKKNNGIWYVVLAAHDWIKLVKDANDPT